MIGLVSIESIVWRLLCLATCHTQQFGQGRIERSWVTHMLLEISDDAALIRQSAHLQIKK